MGIIDKGIYFRPCSWPSHFTGSFLPNTHFCEKSECCSFATAFCQFKQLKHIASTSLAQPASCLAFCKVIFEYPCHLFVQFLCDRHGRSRFDCLGESTAPAPVGQGQDRCWPFRTWVIGANLWLRNRKHVCWCRTTFGMMRPSPGMILEQCSWELWMMLPSVVRMPESKRVNMASGLPVTQPAYASPVSTEVPFPMEHASASMVGDLPPFPTGVTDLEMWGRTMICFGLFAKDDLSYSELAYLSGRAQSFLCQMGDVTSCRCHWKFEGFVLVSHACQVWWSFDQSFGHSGHHSEACPASHDHIPVLQIFEDSINNCHMDVFPSCISQIKRN